MVRVQPLQDGQLFSLLWAWGYGRFFQTASLFLLGMLMGRRTVVCQPVRTSGFWMRTLVIGAVCFVPLYFITASLPGYDLQQGDADSDEHGGFLFPQFLFHVCVGRLFCLPVATSFDP
ncbi:MAG: hypothetical protein ACLR6J_15125 [Parabacteroides merdae]